MRGAAFFWIVFAAISIPALSRPPVHGGVPFVAEAKDKADEYKADKQEYKADKGKYEYKWERGGCKYEYKADKKGVKEKYECKE